MSFQLDTGICQRRIDSATFNEGEFFDHSPTLQVLSLKKFVKKQDNTDVSSDRYRIVLSDGAHFLQTVLATNLNFMVVEENIKKYSIISLERLSCSYVQEKRLVVIMALRILGQADEKIGKPIPLETNLPEAPTPPTVEKSLRQPTAQLESTSIRDIPALSVCRPPQRGNCLPIEALSPYQNNWTIKAKITRKSELKSYSNARGEGKVFNVTFKDETGEIRAAAFNTLAENLFPKLEEGKVYYVSKGKVNLANKKFSNVHNDFEITLEKKSEITECLETLNLPIMEYSFVALRELHGSPKSSICTDVIGILKEYGDVSVIASPKATDRLKRDLTLVDKSGFSARVTLWGDQAKTFNPGRQNENIAYPACETCNKKVVEEGDSWRCDKCDKILSRPTYRYTNYIMSFAVSDHTGQAWFHGFNDVGNTLFGKSANEMTEIKDSDDVQYNTILTKACCKSYNFLLRAKREFYIIMFEHNRIRYGVVCILPLNYKEENKAC
ncbi:replication factor-A C terminal domain-containing protein [Lentinula raphanica]|nr:replication factor-A C terminal domain-containing protein [Lentinula raphanica]